MLEIIDDQPLVAGMIVGNKFRLDRPIGEGGMGVVWAATHVLTEKRCALKFLKTDRLTDPKAHARLLNEARAICRVKHPNVAEVHDVLELDNGAPFMVMDLLEGQTLSARLAAGPALTNEEILELITPLLSAMSTIHKLGLVHRDLKPDNVYLEDVNGTSVVRILDFGIAKHFNPAEQEGLFSSKRRLTSTNGVVGTPSYMAPEQLRVGGHVGPSADVFAIGVVLYECLAGMLPPRDEHTSHVLHAEARKILSARMPPVPRALLDLVLDMLAEDANARPTIPLATATITRLATTAAPTANGESSIMGVTRSTLAEPAAPLPGDDVKPLHRMIGLGAVIAISATVIILGVLRTAPASNPNANASTNPAPATSTPITTTAASAPTTAAAAAAAAAAPPASTPAVIVTMTANASRIPPTIAPPSPPPPAKPAAVAPPPPKVSKDAIPALDRE